MLTTIEKVIALQEVDIFTHVSTEQLALLAAIATEREHASGDVVYEAKDPADSMYLVVGGKVRLHVNGMDITTAGPGETFGTWSLFDDEPRVSAATAAEDSTLVRLDKEDFIDLLADNVEITQGVMKALVARVRGLIGRVGSGTEETG